MTRRERWGPVVTGAAALLALAAAVAIVARFAVWALAVAAGLALGRILWGRLAS